MDFSWERQTFGAAIGITEWCEPLLGKREDRAQALPTANRQTRRLTWRVRFTLLTYSCRTVPPGVQSDNLLGAGRDVRHALNRLLGTAMWDLRVPVDRLVLSVSRPLGVAFNSLDFAGFACADSCDDSGRQRS